MSSERRSTRRVTSVSEPADTEKPLSDLRVLELGHIVAAPYATLMLSDLGADVVKVEHPEHGDQMRTGGDTARAIFAALNRDKQSIGLDLTSSEDRRAFLQLVGECDVLVENFSPGVLERLDLATERLHEANESLIHVSIKGYGENGPYTNQPATDPIVQAMSGIMSVTGHADSPPTRAGTSVVDIATAQNAVVAILSALRRERDPKHGESITVPLFRTGVSLMSYWLAYQQQSGENPQRSGASHALYAPYDIYPTADDNHVFIGAASDEHWQSIKTTFDLSLGFKTRDERAEHRETIDDPIEAITSQLSREELVNRLLDAGVPAAPVNEVSDVVTDPHLVATDALTVIDTTESDDIAVPWTISWHPAPSRSQNPPELNTDVASLFDSFDTNDTDE